MMLELLMVLLSIYDIDRHPLKSQDEMKYQV
jgi:hypothetical protein